MDRFIQLHKDKLFKNDKTTQLNSAEDLGKKSKGKLKR